MHLNVITKLKKFRITIHNKSNYTNKWEEKLPIFSGNIHKNAKEDQMDPLIIFWLLFGFYLSSTAWDLYLTLRQYRLYKTTERRPDNVLEIISEEEFTKARDYKLDKMSFGLIVSVFTTLITSVVLLGNILPVFWNIAGVWSKFIWANSGEIFHSLLFLYGITIVETLISMPFTCYDTFVIEQKHGFNKETIPFFIKDRFKKLVISLAITGPILGAMLWIIKIGGQYFYIYAWAFLTAITFVMMTIYPEFIAPLFDKYTALPESSLKTKIEELASKLNFPLKKLYVVHGSKRSTHSNAYMYGFWKNKRIVLFDTLLDSHLNDLLRLAEEEKGKKDSAEEKSGGETTQETNDLLQKNHSDTSTKPDTEEKKRKQLGMSEDEVVAILGHELGHWKLSHTLCNLIIAEANLFLMLIAFSYFYRQKGLYSAFGFNSQPILVGLIIIFQFVMAPYNDIMGIAQSFLSRKMEFSADEFSAKLGYANLLRSGLIKLSKDNLSLPIDDWLYSAINHSHPPIPERIDALKRYE